MFQRHWVDLKPSWLSQLEWRNEDAKKTITKETRKSVKVLPQWIHTQASESRVSKTHSTIILKSAVSTTPLSFRHCKAWALDLDQRKRVAYVNHATVWRENHDNTISLATSADRPCKTVTYRYVGGITLPGQTANIRAWLQVAFQSFLITRRVSLFR